MRGMEVRGGEESLCEMSLKVVANIMRLSAFSISQRSLGNGGGNNGNNYDDHPAAVVASSKKNDLVKAKTTPFMAPSKPLLRAQKPKPMPQKTYLVEPDHDHDHLRHNHHGHHQHHLVKEDMNVDGRASDYIRKVRQKNQKELLAVTNNETSFSCKVPRSRTI